MLIRNKYAKKCESCKTHVDIGAGFAFNRSGRWGTVCSSKACFRALNLEPPKKAQQGRITVDGKLFMEYDSSALPLLRSLPGSRWNGEENCREFSTKPEDLARVLEIADQLKLEVPQELRDREKLGTEESREAEKRTATIGLYDFQREGVKFLSLHKRALLADEMGTGKSVQALAALPDNVGVIIISPASLKYNWQAEAKKWRKEFKITVLSGKKSFRFPENNEIVIINYDILPASFLPQKQGEGREQYVPDQETIDAMKNVVLIVDEAHKVKNFKAAQSKKVASISRLAKSVWFLTGTPMLNRPGDLFGVLCSGNMNVFGKMDNFARLFGSYRNKFGGREWGDPSPEVSEKLRRIMLRRLRKDVLKDLPSKTYQVLTINDMSDSLKEKLSEIMINIIVDKSEGITHEEAKKLANDKIVNLLEKLGDDGLPSFEQFASIRAELARSRIPAALEIIEQYEDGEVPLVVFSDHQDPIREIGKRDGWEVIFGDTPAQKRQQIVDDFQAGKLKGVALTIKTGGVGFTLTRASDALFIDLDWTPAYNLQAEDRLNRIGQKASSVLIKHMVSSHPLDQHVQNLLREKMRMMELAIEKQAYIAKEPRAGVELKPETDEELKARLDALTEAEKEVERKRAVDKVHGLLDRERARSTKAEPKLTQDRKDMIREALNYMIGNCDGAKERDNRGFNKPDAGIAHSVFRTGLRNDDEVTFRVIERVLSRYYDSQLKGMFEIW